MRPSLQQADLVMVASGLVPSETRAGTALRSIQKETQDRTTISMVGK